MDTPLIYVQCKDKYGYELIWEIEGYNLDNYRTDERKIVSLSLLDVGENEETDEMYLAVYNL